MNREKSILIIDDNEKMLMPLLKGSLSDSGVDNILTVSDRGEAVKAIDAVDFDLIILEVNMLYGIEILKYIKKRRPKTKIIVYSKCDYKTKKEAENIGIDEFISKGVPVSMILDAVQYVLR